MFTSIAWTALAVGHLAVLGKGIRIPAGKEAKM
uniref:Uncharacterized protein n=1 Tax=Anguilla anguilla TaxID=7936 RepID=A0A0E9XYI9_ANGAN